MSAVLIFFNDLNKISAAIPLLLLCIAGDYRTDPQLKDHTFITPFLVCRYNTHTCITPFPEKPEGLNKITE